jgi:hypothetical protein
MPDSGTVPRVSHEVVVDRVIGAVFDVVTTASYWPQWHPATRAVEGDIDRPARLGDEIIEHVTIAGREGSGTWTVVEHDPPNHLALESDTAMGHLRISYQLSAMGVGRTRFQRDLDYPDLGARVAAAMQSQSGEGVRNLARLVEALIPVGA